MRKVSVADLKASLPGPDAEAGSFESRETERFRTEMERSPNGIKTLLAVARLASRIDGFPDFVSIHLKNGPKDGFGVVRRADGVWRLAGDRRVLGRAYGNGYGRSSTLHSPPLAFASPADIAPFAAEAMGIPASPEANRKLAELCAWGDDIGHELAAVYRFLPEHTIHASVGYGSEILKFLGYDPTSSAVPMLDALERLGFALEGRSTEDATPNINLLAHHGDEVFLAEVLRRVDHGQAHEDITLAALTTADYGTLASLQRLVAAGADLHAVDEGGNTLLHRAVLRLEEGNWETAPAMVEWLLSEGVSPSAKNTERNTPAAMVKAILKRMEDYRYLDPNQVETAESVKEMLSGKPRPGLGR